MDAETRRLAVAVLLAGLVGASRGLGATAAPALGAAGIPPREIGVALGAVSAVGLVSRVGLFVAGYAWARRADVPAAYGRFALYLLAAGLVGIWLGTIPSPLLGGQSAPATLAVASALSPSAVFVPLPALSGGAIAQYWSVRGEG